MVAHHKNRSSLGLWVTRCPRTVLALHSPVDVGARLAGYRQRLLVQELEQVVLGACRLGCVRGGPEFRDEFADGHTPGDEAGVLVRRGPRGHGGASGVVTSGADGERLGAVVDPVGEGPERRRGVGREPFVTCLTSLTVDRVGVARSVGHLSPVPTPRSYFNKTRVCITREHGLLGVAIRPCAQSLDGHRVGQERERRVGPVVVSDGHVGRGVGVDEGPDAAGGGLASLLRRAASSESDGVVESMTLVSVGVLGLISGMVLDREENRGMTVQKYDQ